LKAGLNTLGRGPLNEIRLDNPSVSAAHAEIMIESGSVTVKDLRSTNGTFVNRSQILQGFLQPGQTLSLGSVEMLFVSEEAAPAVGPGGVARTIALPQVGGIKITRPAAHQPVSGGLQLPNNYPVPTAPAPNLTTTPTPLNPGAAQPAPTVRQVQAQTQAAAPAPVARPTQAHAAPSVPIQDRTWKHVPTTPSQPGVLRSLGFGLGAAVLCGLIWALIAATVGISPAPIALAATGLICGLALRIASRNSSGAAFSLLAIGCTLLGIFIGEFGQVFAGQHISFAGFNLLALLGGILGSALLGGFSFSPKPRLARA